MPMARRVNSHGAWDKMKQWGNKAVPFVIVGLIAFALGLKFTDLDINRGKSDTKAPTDLTYTSVEQLYDNLRTKYDGDLDAQKLVDGMKKGLVEASGDPYTTY